MAKKRIARCTEQGEGHHSTTITAFLDEARSLYECHFLKPAFRWTARTQAHQCNNTKARPKTKDLILLGQIYSELRKLGVAYAPRWKISKPKAHGEPVLSWSASRRTKFCMKNRFVLAGETVPGVTTVSKSVIQPFRRFHLPSETESAVPQDLHGSRAENSTHLTHSTLPTFDIMTGRVQHKLQVLMWRPFPLTTLPTIAPLADFKGVETALALNRRSETFQIGTSLGPELLHILLCLCGLLGQLHFVGTSSLAISLTAAPKTIGETRLKSLIKQKKSKKQSLISSNYRRFGPANNISLFFIVALLLHGT